uniref:IDP1438 n=1 Tax=Arundo donax TaxID=35708 RepID=A0A0A9CWN8_ARUDO
MPPSLRTTVWCQLWSLRSFLTVSTASTGPSRSHRRCGRRHSTTWLRTMSCLRASSSSPAWLPLVLSARTRPPLSKLLTTPSSSSTEGSPQLSQASCSYLVASLRGRRPRT